MLSPRQIFEDNIRPAELMLRVYRLLEHDVPTTDGTMVQALRALVQAEADEGLMLIYNEIFLGLIRERAQIAPMAIRRSALRNLFSRWVAHDDVRARIITGVHPEIVGLGHAKSQMVVIAGGASDEDLVTIGRKITANAGNLFLFSSLFRRDFRRRRGFLKTQ